MLLHLLLNGLGVVKMVKVKFAVEKSMYSSYLRKLLSGDQEEMMIAYYKMQCLEEVIKGHGDEMITIVSTKDTYDGQVALDPMEGPWTKADKATPTITNTVEVPGGITPTEEKKIVDEVVSEAKRTVENVTDEFKPEPSPQCKTCRHKEISHNVRGCRFCDCAHKGGKE